MILQVIRQALGQCQNRNLSEFRVEYTVAELREFDSNFKSQIDKLAKLHNYYLSFPEDIELEMNYAWDKLPIYFAKSLNDIFMFNCTKN